MAQHFYDDDATPVLDALEALALVRPDIAFDRAQKVVYRTDHDAIHSVALISGGGAGHEPTHAGFVGRGGLTAAVSGTIFASPNVPQIVSAMARVAGPAGVLLIVKNYTGDIFHFHLAAEKAKAALGLPVEVLVVADDVAVGRAKGGKVGRRGLAGTVLVHKILGAFTAAKTTAGATANVPPSLDEVLALGRQIVDNLATVGASLGHVQIPGRKATAAAGAETRGSESVSQVELGMGIHNEPGCRVLAPRPSLGALIETMLDQLLDDKDTDRAFVSFAGAENVVLLVNNLGGVSPLEFGGITTKAVHALENRAIRPVRLLSGTYMTSLNGPGFSITLLRATPHMVALLDAPTTAAHWIKASPLYEAVDPNAKPIEMNDGIQVKPSNILLDAAAFRRTVSAACAAVAEKEAIITEYDTVVGDGDCGVTLARGAKAAAAYVNDGSHKTDDAVKLLTGLATAVEDSMDGTSGALYSIFFAALASEVSRLEPGLLSSRTWFSAATKAFARLQLATPARQGDRTLMDALEPFIRELAKCGDLSVAVAQAQAGVEATKGMKASLGRAVYVEESNWQAVPDPGAVGVQAILEGILASLS